MLFTGLEKYLYEFIISSVFIALLFQAKRIETDRESRVHAEVMSYLRQYIEVKN